MVVGVSRRQLAQQLGHPDTTGTIPQARRQRANIFERLVRAEEFVSPLISKAIGAIDLQRPDSVRRAQCGINKEQTALALESAHEFAVSDNGATLLTDLAVPFVGLEDEPGATPVKPDFAVVCARHDDDGDILGSWLIMGDAKDYERVRTKIDDQRMLKGFLQVALGAESIGAWSRLPDGMQVHTWGALAVPRNAFLQPEPVVENLSDHRREVRARVDERTELVQELGGLLPEHQTSEFVEHLVATFDPATCRTCSLHNYCQRQLRDSTTADSLLIELGVRPEERAALLDIVEGNEAPARAPASEVARVRASLTGVAEHTGKLRTDVAGEPGTVSFVIAKSDSAALGVYGVAWRVFDPNGQEQPWNYRVFKNAQSPGDRLAIMSIAGEAIGEASGGEGGTHPVHFVIPDGVTGDVLASIADSLAGVELSRLRWEQDIAMGREPLTFDGEPASVPRPLSSSQRLAVSLFLEEDRARTMTLRSVFVNLREVVAEHLIVGGPTFEIGRLDYLMGWARVDTHVDFRRLSDQIANEWGTPGARLSNTASNDIHNATTAGDRPDPVRYDSLVQDALKYKTALIDDATAFLQQIPPSRTREPYWAIEADAQEVWRRRSALEASDLVRFGRTFRTWRNDQVELLDAHGRCSEQLAALSNSRVAYDFAGNAGMRDIALATVVSIDPLEIDVHSRSIGAESSVVLLSTNHHMMVEEPQVSVNVQKGGFKFADACLGPLTEGGQALHWDCAVRPDFAIGDELVVADAGWFAKADYKTGHEFLVNRPSCDTASAPKTSCTPTSYETDPDEHQWCCRSHLIAESEWSDELARRREAGELNPEIWPPVVDEDEFDIAADGSPTDETIGNEPDAGAAYDEMTMDDLE